MMKSIKYSVDKIKLINRFLDNKDIFVILMLILISCVSFGLGRLSKIEENITPLRANDLSNSTKNSASITGSQNMKGKYVASKSGTKYHLPWCSGAQRIKDGNKIWFETKGDAESRGYSPAKNCKGI